MKRALQLVGALVCLGAVILLLWAARIHSPVQSDQEPRGVLFDSVITNPVAFAKSRLTGGVGVLIQLDSATGHPKVQAVVPGSPAEQAGLQPLDRIVEIDGVATIGQPLVQTIERITGFAGGSVTLSVQRFGDTNMEFVLRRSSWNRLGVPQ